MMINTLNYVSRGRDKHILPHKFLDFLITFSRLYELFIEHMKSVIRNVVLTNFKFYRNNELCNNLMLIDDLPLRVRWNY